MRVDEVELDEDVYKDWYDMYSDSSLTELRKIAKKDGELKKYSDLDRENLMNLIIVNRMGQAPDIYLTARGLKYKNSAELKKAKEELKKLPPRVENPHLNELASLTPPPSLNNNPVIVKKTKSKAKKKPKQNITTNISRQTRTDVLKDVKAKKARECGKYKNLARKTNAELMKLI